MSNHCSNCRHNYEGYCKALPPREQTAQRDTEVPHDDTYYIYPQVIPTSEGCVYWQQKPPVPP